MVYSLENFFLPRLWGGSQFLAFYDLRLSFFIEIFSFQKQFPNGKAGAKSLLLPYVLWNILYYLGYVVVTRLSFVENIIGKEPVAFNLKRTAFGSSLL